MGAVALRTPVLAVHIGRSYLVSRTFEAELGRTMPEAIEQVEYQETNLYDIATQFIGVDGAMLMEHTMVRAGLPDVE